MSDTLLFDSLNASALDGNAVMLMPSVGGAGTEGVLKDVSNLPQKRRLSSPNDKYWLISSYSANEKINMLLKLSELKGMAMRVPYFDVYCVHAALFEINADRDKLRVLRHELACARAVVAVKDFELQEKKKAKMHPRSAVKMHSMKSDKAGDPSQTNNNNHKPSNTRGKRLSIVGITSAAKGFETKENSENRRVSLRRQSSAFETGEVDSTDDAIGASEGITGKERLSLSRQSSPFVTEGADSTQDAIKAFEYVPTKENISCRRLSLVRKSPTSETEDMNPAEDVIRTAEGLPTSEKPNNRRVSLRRQSTVRTKEMRSTEHVLNTEKADSTDEKSQASRLGLSRRRSSRFITKDSTVDMSEVDAAPVCFQLNDGANEGDLVPSAAEKSDDPAALVKEKSDDPAAENVDEDMFDTEDTKSHLHPRVTEGSVDDSVARYIRRSSLARPIRKAAEKVQSYREAPIRSKMRRID
ncbi:SHUGOSHIN 2-like protein [Drosera capensis]